MQHQSAVKISLSDNVGFTYVSNTRTFTCLDQVFKNVAIFEIDLYREIAINNYNNNHCRDKSGIREITRSRPVEKPQQKRSTKPQQRPTPKAKSNVALNTNAKQKPVRKQSNRGKK